MRGRPADSAPATSQPAPVFVTRLGPGVRSPRQDVLPILARFFGGSGIVHRPARPPAIYRRLSTLACTTVPVTSQSAIASSTKLSVTASGGKSAPASSPG